MNLIDAVLVLCLMGLSWAGLIVTGFIMYRGVIDD